MNKHLDFNERAIPGVTSNLLMQEAMARYKFVLKHLKNDLNILDLACGVGYGTDMLHKDGRNTYGLDIDSDTITYARKQYEGKGVTFLQGNALSTPFKDNYFDCVVAYEMIEHIARPTKLLKEIKRVLKKGGTLFVSTPNSLVQSPNGIYNSPYHVHEYTPDELSALLTKHFSKVNVYGQSKKPIAQKAHSKFMQSQGARSMIVKLDIFNIRFILSREKREVLWKSLGALFGRQAQEKISIDDFNIRTRNINSSEYLIAVCRK